MTVRYIVSDLETSLDFYLSILGFQKIEQWGSAFATITLDGLELWLSGPQTSAAQKMPDGRVPVPGGWNRIVITIADFEKTVARLKEAGTVFRNDPITGPGGTQVLIEDPSGNPIELFSAR